MPCPRQHQQAASKSPSLPQAFSHSFEHSFIMSSLWLSHIELPFLVACWPAQLQTNCLDVSCSLVDHLAIMPALTSSISQIVCIILQGCNYWLAKNQQHSVNSLSTVQPVDTASKVCAIQTKLFLSLQSNSLIQAGLTTDLSVLFYHASIPPAFTAACFCKCSAIISPAACLHVCAHLIHASSIIVTCG